MKSRAYGPSHDRIITPNACSQHFKGHFIPEPTPHRASHQSRWPDLNQVLPPVFCDVPHPRLYLTSEESAASELVLCKIIGIKLEQQHVQTRSFSMSHGVLMKWAEAQRQDVCASAAGVRELHVACHRGRGEWIKLGLSNDSFFESRLSSEFP